MSRRRARRGRSTRPTDTCFRWRPHHGSTPRRRRQRHPKATYVTELASIRTVDNVRLTDAPPRLPDRASPMDLPLIAGTTGHGHPGGQSLPPVGPRSASPARPEPVGFRSHDPCAMIVEPSTPGPSPPRWRVLRPLRAGSHEAEAEEAVVAVTGGSCLVVRRGPRLGAADVAASSQACWPPGDSSHSL